MFHEVFIGKNENNLFQLLCRSQIYIIIGGNAIHDGLPQSVRDTIPASVSAPEKEPGLCTLGAQSSIQPQLDGLLAKDN